MAATETITSLRQVFGNRSLRRVQLAWFGSGLGDWAYSVGIAVFAYHHGGPAAVGIYQAVRFLVGAVAGPLGAVVADRVPRRTFMMSSDAIRAVLLAVAAVCIGAHAPAVVVYAVALLAVIAGSSFRPAQAGLIPKLVDTPEQLTAANAIGGNIDTTVIFAGSALGGVLVGLYGVETAFWLDVASFAWSFLLVLGVRVPPERVAEPDVSELFEDRLRQLTNADSEPGFLSEAGAGFRAIAKDRDLRAVTLLVAAQGFLWGALIVFMVLMAVHILHTGASGQGYLTAVNGVGGVLGGLLVLTRIAKGTLGRDMVFGVLGWALPLIVVALAPNVVVALVALAVIGLSDPYVNLGFDTIPQRIVSDELMSRTFAAVESALIASMALGSAVAPLFVHLIGFRESMALFGVVVALYALSRLPLMSTLDKRLSAPAELPLLQRISLFAPLAQPTVERLARNLERVSVPAGAVVIEQGGTSDRFYVIESGEIEVTQGERVLRREGPGEFFGEIGLLRDVPRTATITAVSDTVLLALSRVDFLTAVTGTESRAAAEDIASRRLAV